MATQSPVYSGNTLPLRPRMRQACKVLIESLPVIGDLFHRYWRYARTDTACRGVYGSREAALEAISATGRSDYDACNEARSLEEDLHQTHQHEYEDYPVLFWLKGLLRPDLRVVDLGGSVGGTFYAFDRALVFPSDLSWTVAELPAAVRQGRAVAEARSEPRLAFVTDPQEAERPDVLLTMGTLQYLPTVLADIVCLYPSPPRDVIVHKVPVTEGGSFWTIQNLGAAQVPYFVYDRNELVRSMRDSGYELTDGCSTLRSIRIPFHPERDVHHYAGFHFRRTTQN